MDHSQTVGGKKLQFAVSKICASQCGRGGQDLCLSDKEGGVRSKPVPFKQQGRHHLATLGQTSCRHLSHKHC